MKKIMARDSLAEERIMQGFTQELMCELIEMTEANYCNVENQKQGTSIRNANKICDILQKDFLQLFQVSRR